MVYLERVGITVHSPPNFRFSFFLKKKFSPLFARYCGEQLCAFCGTNSVQTHHLDVLCIFHLG